MQPRDQAPARAALARCRELARLFGISAQDLIKAGAPARRSRGRQVAQRSPEQHAALGTCLRLIQFYEISARELIAAGVPRGSHKRAQAAAALGKAPAPVKYRHPLTGLTWNGFGRQPLWLKTALTQEGYRVEELLLRNAAA